jgi:hypothetical protein
MSASPGPFPVPEVATRAGRRKPATTGRRAGRSDAAARFAEPGRAAFEFSLALSALSLAFPWLVIGSVAAAVRAWQRRSPIAWRALLAAAWCCLLGLVIRQYLGFGIFP